MFLEKASEDQYEMSTKDQYEQQVFAFLLYVRCVCHKSSPKNTASDYTWRSIINYLLYICRLYTRERGV